MTQKISVTFNSDTDKYYKEREGKKRNTVRKIDEYDGRFTQIPTHICIRHKQKPEEVFVRELTDVTDYDGYRIFSW